MVCPLELRIYRTEHPSIHGRGALLFFVSCGADFEKQKLQDLRIALRLARGLYALYPIASRFCMSFLRRLESMRMPIGLLDGAALSRKICPIWWNRRMVEFKRYSDGSRAEGEVGDEVFSSASVGFVEASLEASSAGGSSPCEDSCSICCRRRSAS